MTVTRERDFLEAAPTAVGSGMDSLNHLMALQTDYLQNIALYLRQQVADVLCTSVVRGTSQISNSINDTRSHEIKFEIGGKPVEIYRLLAFSTYGTAQAARSVTLNILSLSSAKDGIILTPSTAPLFLPLNVSSVYVMLDAVISNVPCPVNGPADGTNGGLFIYGFTIPDYDRVRNAARS